MRQQRRRFELTGSAHYPLVRGVELLPVPVKGLRRRCQVEQAGLNLRQREEAGVGLSVRREALDGTLQGPFEKGSVAAAAQLQEQRLQQHQQRGGGEARLLLVGRDAKELAAKEVGHMQANAVGRRVHEEGVLHGFCHHTSRSRRPLAGPQPHEGLRQPGKRC
jgi:hypothetical protein